MELIGVKLVHNQPNIRVLIIEHEGQRHEVLIDIGDRTSLGRPFLGWTDKYGIVHGEHDGQ